MASAFRAAFRPRRGWCAMRTLPGLTAAGCSTIFRRASLPVAIENDANCFALSEAADGPGRVARWCSALSWGRAWAAVSVHNGKPLLGHNAVAASGAIIRCPGRTRTNGPGRPAIAASAAASRRSLSGRRWSGSIRRLGQAAPAQLIAGRAKAGESAAQSALANLCEEACEIAGNGDQHRRSGCDCVRGGVSNIGVIREMTILELPARVFSDCFDTPLMVNKWGDSGGVRGAARLIVPR